MSKDKPHRAFYGFGLLSVFIASVAARSADAGDLEFKKHVINDQTDFSAAGLIDVDNDGDLDVVCGSHWYEFPSWRSHPVAEIPRIGGRPDGFAHLEFDVNRDGWTDIITVNYRSRSIRWLEHPGASLGPWTMHLAVEPGPMETGRLVDVDGDGSMDLLPNGARFAAWWEFRWNDDVPGSPPAWVRHDLPPEAGGHGIGFGDIDGDGRGDIIGQHGWLRAPEDARNGKWDWHADFSLERASIPMIVADVDDDGDGDIVWCSAHGFGVYWMEQTSDAKGNRIWHRHAIDTSWSQGHSPLWIDMDGDGRNELVTGKRYMAHGGRDPGEYDPIAIYRYQFDPMTHTWNRWTVSEIGQRVGVGLDPKAADLDGDGDLDLIASGRSGLYWLENLGQRNRENTQRTSHYLPGEDQLLMVNDGSGQLRSIEEPEAWGTRREQIVEALLQEPGSLPSSHARTPLDVHHLSGTNGQQHSSFQSDRIEYSIDSGRRVSATLLTPRNAAPGSCAGVVCLYDQSQMDQARRTATALADRGIACIIPDIAGHQDRSQIIDGVWQAMRAIDVLQALDAVHGERIGMIGDAVGGQVGLFAAAIDQRLIATATDSSALRSLPDSGAVPLAELLAVVAPRALHLTTDSDLSELVTTHVKRARAVFSLRKVDNQLVVTQDFDSSRAAEWISMQLL